MLTLAFLAVIACRAPATEPIVPKNWLVIEPVDKSGRRPLRPDAVFAKHLLERGAPPPKKGEVLRGEADKDCAWKEATAGEDGRLEGSIGYAYSAIESDAERVWMAKLSGASQLYVNGAGFVGDAYGYGFGGVPIALAKGQNDVFVAGVRGGFRLELWEPEGELFLASWDVTLPDVVARTDAILGGRGAVVVVNSSIRTQAARIVPSGALPPLSIAKVPFAFGFGLTSPANQTKHTITVTLDDAASKSRRTFDIALRSAGEPRRSTFVSSEDDSVQEYAVRPATDKQTAVVLSLHGASVDCWSQINAYSSKPEFTIIAPTNRRPYGFDWQDWGRTNAYETLITECGEVPSPLYLTGHSMGGHGTWSLAANDPDAFAAIAPSAGWASFDTYGGRPQGEFAELWQAADGTSRTLNLLENLVQIPTFVLHGTADDNVPLAEAETMEKALTDAGHPPQFHHQEGAGHWWDGDRAPGADCVDWPEIFELFRNTKPRGPAISTHFTTVDPSVDAGNSWLAVLELERYGLPAEVTSSMRKDDKALDIVTKNVRYLRLQSLLGAPEKLLVDGGEIPIAHGGVDLLREKDAWTVLPGTPHLASPISAAAGWRAKSPEFSGPFKRAFRRHFVLVYGTAGTPEEQRESYERARADAQIWWYRGNGYARLLSDSEYLADKSRATSGRNAILYGNADTNRVWKERVGERSPIQARRGSIKLGGREWKGNDLCAFFVFPSTLGDTDDPELFGLVGDSGPQGTRLGYTLATFVSGVGYPDYTVFGPQVLARGDGGVLAAGWFDALWQLDGHGFVRAETEPKVK
jgi:pimeloyl-ACP methyl ester carboxylesterase